MMRNPRLVPACLLFLGVLPGLASAGAEQQAAAARERNHWAFQPVVRPALPIVRDAGRARTPVDRFVLAALERKGLTLAAEADRPTLARRLCFDLTGLPPTPEEVAAFVADQSANAYSKLVERYLASPQYGERWGKYWLDAAGYADSNGYFSADSDRPFAWRYRDYVIRSFDQDKPFDRFVQEQLAGDELAGYVPGDKVTPEMVDLLVATHFLRNAPDGTGESDGNPDEVRTDRFTVLEGTLQVTMNCLLGTTIQCARCHAHKFEPITHEEYYRLEAIFYPGYCPDRWVVPSKRIIELGPPDQIAEHKRRTELIDRQVKALQSSLKPVAGPLQEQLLDERLRVLGPEREAVVKAMRTPKQKQSAEQKALLEKHQTVIAITDDDLAKRFPEYAALREQVRRAVAAREKERPQPLESLSVFVETDPNPPVHHVLKRGQHNAPGREVQPGVPAAFCTAGNGYRIEAAPQQAPAPSTQEKRQPRSSGRRTAFARWVTSPANPLFARVMVNRIWQHHFGTGLVSTPDNLGVSGARPSHPELIDYLASEFVRSGWSVKALHRLIVMSAVYRQSSTPGEKMGTGTGRTSERSIASTGRPEPVPIFSQEAADAENRLLWHFPLRRLDAEAVRDGMLAVSGEIDVHRGGPYVPTRRNAEGAVEVDEQGAGARRRSVYLQQRRTQVLTLLELFDAPAIVSTCGVRTTSTVPLQSLTLLNSDFAQRRALAFVRRLEHETGLDQDRCISRAFQLACARDPTAVERAASRRFLAAQDSVYEKQKDRSQRAWTDFCQMILASNAFLYVE
jgi:Protein of unknown function (DUF1553)/Protein of unknown function (DUF1549)